MLKNCDKWMWQKTLNDERKSHRVSIYAESKYVRIRLVVLRRKKCIENKINIKNEIKKNMPNNV